MHAPLLLACFFLIYSALNVLAEQEQDEHLLPAVVQGEFAIDLCAELGFGAIVDEAEAQGMLEGIGVQPQGGWAVEDPITLEVIAELRVALLESLESGRLAMTEIEALGAFDRLALRLGPVETQTHDVIEGDPSLGQKAYDAGPNGYAHQFPGAPPVITYSPPPAQHYSDYDWVPYPFYYARRYYSGYYILHHHRRHHMVDRHRTHKMADRREFHRSRDLRKFQDFHRGIGRPGHSSGNSL